MRWSSYFIAKERKSVSSHTNRFKPVTAMSINKDTSNFCTKKKFLKIFFIAALDGPIHA